ncbi:MAG: nucleotidyltransferase domain-containing protein [Chitinophagales bacterium]
MADQTTAVKTAKDFIDACRTNGITISDAWLFGSSAKGNAHEYSDIDLALVSDLFTHNFIENNHKTALLNWKFPDIEVHHFNTNVFQQNDPFVNEIKQSGIKIF